MALGMMSWTTVYSLIDLVVNIDILNDKRTYLRDIIIMSENGQI